MSKTKTTTTTASVDQVPPYSFYLPGMTAEEAAVAAVKALRTPHLCDALALLWQLRRVSKNEQAEYSSAIDNATESISGDFAIPPQSQPPITPAKNERNST